MLIVFMVAFGDAAGQRAGHDLFLAVAMFGWGGRLIHPLGGPVAAAG